MTAPKLNTMSTGSDPGTALDTLGTIFGSEVTGRDAIHIATVPVTSEVTVYPGQHVGLKSGSQDVADPNAADKIGIVDPFLSGPIFPGSRYWMLLYPRTITSLRHEWTHPSFTPVVLTVERVVEVEVPVKGNKWGVKYTAEVERAEERLAEHYAYGTTLDHMIDSIEDWSGEDYLSVYGQVEGDIGRETWDDMKRDYEIVTGKKITADGAPEYFSCSC